VGGRGHADRESCRGACYSLIMVTAHRPEMRSRAAASIGGCCCSNPVLPNASRTQSVSLFTGALRGGCSPPVRLPRYTALVSRWCTVTVTDSDERRHSLDVPADSTYDAAHLFVVEAKKARAVGLPKPTLATVFEVVANGKVYHMAGTALQRWIVERRQKWNGPKGYLFSQRPGLE
jgi:hypothetical protein